MSDLELATALRIVETEFNSRQQTDRHVTSDDEPWTREDEAAVAESRADFAAGRTLSHEEILRKYG